MPAENVLKVDRCSSQPFNFGPIWYIYNCDSVLCQVVFISPAKCQIASVDFSAIFKNVKLIIYIFKINHTSFINTYNKHHKKSWQDISWRLIHYDINWRLIHYDISRFLLSFLFTCFLLIFLSIISLQLILISVI